MRWTNGSYEIDDNRSRLDMDRIVAWLAESYWAGTQPEAAVRRSWDAAGVTLGLYHGDQMVGCTRAITDLTRFAYLSDVYVEPEHRGHGLGRWLVQTMLNHPAVPRVRWVLHTDVSHRTSVCGTGRPDCAPVHGGGRSGVGSGLTRHAVRRLAAEGGPGLPSMPPSNVWCS